MDSRAQLLRLKLHFEEHLKFFYSCELSDNQSTNQVFYFILRNKQKLKANFIVHFNSLY